MKNLWILVYFEMIDGFLFAMKEFIDFIFLWNNLNISFFLWNHVEFIYLGNNLKMLFSYEII